VLDPTKRFSNRVENYLKHRPSYPRDVIDLLKGECGLTSGSVTADVGSGTGLLSELLLKEGCKVFCVEPNAGMRAAAEKFLAKYPNFTSINGTAENTTLSDNSTDVITVGQAFHWFEPRSTREEFLRILKPGGWVALVWNGFQITTDATAAFQNLVVSYSTDYHQAVRELSDQDIENFFRPGRCRREIFQNEQRLDFEGLRGRLLSMSYAPQPDEANYQPLLDGLREVFDQHQQQGKMTISYDTPVYFGQLT
jgi:SAM-dependent methyltransferase